MWAIWPNFAMTRLASGARALVYYALLVVTLVDKTMSEKASSQDNIVKLTKFNFDDNVRRGTWFIKFYAPWCAHCQRLAPIWGKLADHAAAQDWPVKIAEVDCTSNKEVCEKVQVKAFPTLALISGDILKSRYQGEASVSHFEDWLKSQNVLQAGGSMSFSDMTDTSKKQEPTATASAAAGALFANLVTRFPTKYKILNIYIYGFAVLAALVALLFVLFKLVDTGEAEEEHEKEG